jgi:hypothetical protein
LERPPPQFAEGKSNRTADVEAAGEYEAYDSECEAYDSEYEVLLLAEAEALAALEAAEVEVRWRVFTMDSAVLGLAALGCGCCTVRVFQQGFAHLRMPLSFTPLLLRLKLLRACEPMAFLSGVHYLLPVGTVNCIQTLKASGARTVLVTMPLTMDSATPR